MNSFTIDVAKIQFSQEGYLPDIPYHLISTEELLDAFEVFFQRVYALPAGFESLQATYDKLYNAIHEIITHWKALQSSQNNADVFTVDGITYTIDRDHIPDWIMSFMLRRVVCPSSDVLDRHDLLALLEMPNTYDEFNLAAATKCAQISERWVSKLPIDQRRPATIFGEPHVIKSLRLQMQGEL